MPSLRIHRANVYQWTGVVAVWVLILLLRLVQVGGDWLAVSFHTAGFLFAWQVLFLSSWMFAGALWKVDEQQRQHSIVSDEQIIAGSSVIAAAGAILLVIEFAIFRGYGFQTPVAEIRIMEVEAVTAGRGGAVLSGIGRLLMPLLFVAWIVFRQSTRHCSPGTRALLYASTAWVLWTQSAFEGGRFFLLSLVLVIWFSAGTSRKSLVGGKTVALGTLAALIFFGFVFLNRYSSYESGFAENFEQFSSSFSIVVDSTVNERLSGEFGAPWFVVTMFWVYLTHAVSELNVLLAQEDFIHAVGAYQFPQLMQAVRIIFDLQPQFNVFGALANPGVYVTVPGAMYIDFGYAGAYLAAILLGALTGIALEERHRGGPGTFAAVSPLLLVVAIFVPVHSIMPTVWPAILYTCLIGMARCRDCKIAQRAIDQ